MNKVLVGCDPEVFVHNKGKPVTIIGKLGGTKNETLFFDGQHGVLEDNCAAEFNIPPASNVNSFVESVQKCMDYIQNEMSKQGLAILPEVASVSFDAEELVCEEAWVFGCEPDFSAYTSDVNPAPACDDMFLRSAGGHVHIGVGEISRGAQENIVRACDLFLTVPALFKDNDTRRRQLYGKPGAYRPKPYGVEYRTLSNFWVFNVEHTKWVYEQTLRAVAWARENYIDQFGPLAKEVRRVIDTNDLDGAKKLMSEYNL